MDELAEAQALCRRAHEGQVDKAGQPYWQHPFAVAQRVQGRMEKVVAYLHDVVEDTDVTLDDLRKAGFSEQVAEAVDALTRRDGEDYLSEYLPRVCHNDVARAVKKAGLAHNTDPSRAESSTDALRQKYAKAKAIIADYPD